MKRLLVALQCAIPRSRRLWLGPSISYLGDQFTIIALLWFVLQLTGSGAAVGLVILCFDLPGVVTGAILRRLLESLPAAARWASTTSPERHSSRRFPRSTPWDRCS
ncbi:MAG: hypothetical protein WB660_13430 [Candidatus Sulfotelmatobacter sp.]